LSSLGNQGYSCTTPSCLTKSVNTSYLWAPCRTVVEFV
nr:hypothetical protein [Tanacetum cinerariifolium]